MQIEGEALRAVIGQNVYRIRELKEVRQADLATSLRARGVKWSWNRISELEAGKKNVSIEQLVLLADALGDVADAEISLAHLLDGDGQVLLSEDVAVDRAVMRGYLHGDAVDIRPIRDDASFREQAQDVLTRFSGNMKRMGRLMGERGRGVEFQDPSLSTGTAEAKLARKLGESLSVIQAASVGLWGRSLTAERDARSGQEGDSQSLAARRGRITRELQAQLIEHIEAELRGELPEPPSRLVKGDDGVMRFTPRKNGD